MAIYFIQNTLNGRIKIGQSFSVKKRIISLSKNEDAPLRLLGVIPGDLNGEHELHLRFDKIRITGEWFLPTSKLLEFIDKNSVSLNDLVDIPFPEKFSLQSKVACLAKSQGYKTPEALSKKMHLSINTIMNIWTGDVSKRQFATMFAVAKLLNVRMEDLVAINE